MQGDQAPSMHVSSRDHCSQPGLGIEERVQYDRAARRLLQEAVVECFKFNRDWVDPTQWAFLKRRQDVSIYRRVVGDADPGVVQLLGTGLVNGSLEHVASGLCCDTPEELLVTSVLLGLPLAEASVGEELSPKDWVRFDGTKWFAGKCVWGLLQKRGMFTYERTGATTDANGVELIYQTLHTIRRPEWPTKTTPAAPKQITSTCCLYRRHKNSQQTEVFLWSKLCKPHRVPEKLFCLGAPGKLLNVVNSAKAGQAKNFSALIDEADSRYWEASSDACHLCYRKPRVNHYSQCAGCHQAVCKTCSSRRAIFALRRSGRAKKRLFCAVCVKRATGRSLSESKSTFVDSKGADKDCFSSSSPSDFSTCKSDHSRSFHSPRFSVWRPLNPSWSRSSISADEDFADQLIVDWY